jgi:uncharacterized membrane protein SpoIIM required for sporulation
MATETERESVWLRTFAWDVPCLVRCARALALAAVATFLLGVTVGAVWPGLTERALDLLTGLSLWPAAFLSHLVPIFLFILLNNIKAALVASLLGPLSVWANARLNEGSRTEPMGRSLACRAANAVGRGMVALGRRVFPALGDAALDFPARVSAALAAFTPLLVVGLNGAVLGLWLAQGLLSRWTYGLGEVGRQLLPHAPVEFSAFLLAAAVGLRLARELVPQTAAQDAAWQAREARRLVTTDAVAQSLGVVVALLAIAAALELVAITRG